MVEEVFRTSKNLLRRRRAKEGTEEGKEGTRQAVVCQLVKLSKVIRFLFHLNATKECKSKVEKICLRTLFKNILPSFN